MKLSIVIPVYNEEATLAELVGRVLAQPYDMEIILVDDGSRTGAGIMAEPRPRTLEIRCLYHAANKGKGGALSTGFANVTGDLVLIQDADLEYDRTTTAFFSSRSSMGTPTWRRQPVQEDPVGRFTPSGTPTGTRADPVQQHDDRPAPGHGDPLQGLQGRRGTAVDIQSRTPAVEPETSRRSRRWACGSTRCPSVTTGGAQRGQEGRPEGRLHCDLGDRPLAFRPGASAAARERPGASGHAGRLITGRVLEAHFLCRYGPTRGRRPWRTCARGRRSNAAREPSLPVLGRPPVESGTAALTSSSEG